MAGLHVNKFILEGLVWPNLAARDIARIAAATRRVCASHPRSGLPERVRGKARPQIQQSYVRAAAAIEATVARGFGLDGEDLARIYDENRENRRGFWRYFESVPGGWEIARAALRLGAG
jgi:hypothetical protein